MTQQCNIDLIGLAGGPKAGQDHELPAEKDAARKALQDCRRELGRLVDHVGAKGRHWLANALGPAQISTCIPNSTTRLAGMR